MNGINLFAALLGSVGIVLVFSVVAGTAETVLARLGGKAAQRVARWKEGEADPYCLSMLNDRPFLDRLLGPLSSNVARWLGTAAGTAERDAGLLLQAGYPRPFNTLGDFYGWKVITAFTFFLLTLLAAALTGATFFVFAAFILGVFGLYLPDLSLRQAARRRQESFRTEMAFTLDRLAMMLGAGDGAEQAIRRVAGRGGSLFVIEMRGVVDDLNSGKLTLVEALHAVEDEFPIEEYRAFIDTIALSIEQGAPLVATLGDMSNSLQSEIENELLGRGLRTATPMVLGMGIALLNIFILIGAPLAWLWLSSP
ncbi:MAG: type II secretion system F family protein [Ardenticatenia bacterium]|nr:type II secretion system F family protein [Ardenticatenia bacterium]